MTCSFVSTRSPHTIHSLPHSSPHTKAHTRIEKYKIEGGKGKKGKNMWSETWREPRRSEWLTGCSCKKCWEGTSTIPPTCEFYFFFSLSKKSRIRGICYYAFFTSFDSLENHNSTRILLVLPETLLFVRAHSHCIVIERSMRSEWKRK